jgi:hypothetical protein
LSIRMTVMGETGWQERRDMAKSNASPRRILMD